MVEERSAWAVGYATFAAVVLGMAGVFHMIAGLGGIFTDEVYAVTNKWVLQLDATTWGWIYLIGGLLVVVAAASIMKGHMYGRIIGTIAAVLSHRQLRVAPVPALVERPDDLPVLQRHLGADGARPRHGERGLKGPS